MNVKKEVFDKCKKMIEREMSEVQGKLKVNRRQINELAKQQRVLKAQIGKLFEMLRTFK